MTKSIIFAKTFTGRYLKKEKCKQTKYKTTEKNSQINDGPSLKKKLASILKQIQKHFFKKALRNKSFLIIFQRENKVLPCLSQNNTPKRGNIQCWDSMNRFCKLNDIVEKPTDKSKWLPLLRLENWP